jgi:glycosyltransferase involved in cell wall biosynthesis
VIISKQVLYFHQYFSTRQGATGTRSYEFAKALVSKGYSVTVVTGSSQLTNLNQETRTQSRRDYEVEGIQVIEFQLNYSNRDSLLIRSFKFLKYVLKSLMILFSHRSDVVYATSTPLTVAIPGIFASLFMRKTFLFEVRDLWPELPRAMGVVKNPLVLFALDLLETTAYFSAKEVVALAPGIREGVLKKFPRKPTRLLPNGCDLDLFYPGHFPAPAEFTEEKFRALFAGAHGVANGLFAILEAAAVLEEKGATHIELVFIGDGKVKPQMLHKVQQMGLKNCRFIDPLPKDQLNIYFNNCHLGLMTLKNIPAFYHGTSPNKFFDYISSGLPVLNNYPGWIGDLIIEYQAGLNITPDDPALFAQSLIEMSQNPEQRITMGQQARKLAVEKFDRHQIASQFCELIDSHTQ